MPRGFGRGFGFYGPYERRFPFWGRYRRRFFYPFYPNFLNWLPGSGRIMPYAISYPVTTSYNISNPFYRIGFMSPYTYYRY